MKHLIVGVDKGSIAEEVGVKAGFSLVSVNGEDVLDVIDYEQLTADEDITVVFENAEGEQMEAEIEKEPYETLGLNFESGLMSPLRSCKNHCVFCFIDQMPKGVRESLHVKDDDWRLSLIMGNYVTLTNTDEAEFARIIKRRVSPLYISVHSTEPEIRKFMMKNPTAVKIMDRLRALCEAKIRFNAQIVLCPEINDGEHLTRTLEDLYSLYPYAQTVAVVPVGLTRHRTGLHPLRKLTRDECRDAIARIEAINARVKRENDDTFAFASDEMYIAAERELPAYEEYADFLQLENGVGLLRKFEREFCDALTDTEPLEKAMRLDAATGASAYGFLKELFSKLEAKNVFIDLHCVKNEYFGETVTVAGLVTATDIEKQLKPVLAREGEGDGIPSLGMLLIPDDMLREREDVFLDGHTTDELARALDVEIAPLCASDGELFVQGLFEMIK